MKVTIAFLIVALSCFFGPGSAIIGKGKPGSSSGPLIPLNCLKKLLKIEVPETLIKLQELLCLFVTGKKTQNQELYREFLIQLHEALITAGCTVDEILTTPQFLEKVGDQVGKVAEELGFELLNLVGELPISEVVLGALCNLLGETLKSLSKTLAGLDLNVATGLLSKGPLSILG